MTNSRNVVAAVGAVCLRRALLIGLAVLGANLTVEFNQDHSINSVGFSQRAEARGGRGVGGAHVVRPGVVGAPGVARRTARRVSRRWAVGTQLYSLPGDCSWSGGSWYCAEDGVYFYQTTVNNRVVYISR